MRLAFWRGGKGTVAVANVVESPVAAQAPVSQGSAITAPPQAGDLDMRALWQALRRKKAWVIVPTVLAAVISIAVVNLITPRYKSEARILIDGRENIFLRPNC